VRICLKYVSILILLEVPLQQTENMTIDEAAACFNPYFTGSTTSTILLVFLRTPLLCFNPYFTGSTTSTYCGSN